ncbi:MAG: PKD domain-containing protein [Methanospirillaceae archaeon]|nr:PKD domain-containing protein [Methanospirillaceae archaeon]
MKSIRPLLITGVFLLFILMILSPGSGDLIPAGRLNDGKVPMVSGDPITSVGNDEHPAIPDEDRVTSSSCPECQTETDSYGVMILDEKMIHEIEEMDIYEKVHALPMALMTAEELKISSAGDTDLSQYIPYFGSLRNQGSCGNCWVFASTALAEVEMAVKTGEKDQISIQYFNSNYNGGTGTSWACCGGNIGYFTSFYNNAGGKRMVPWSNINAGYADGGKGCSSYPTAQPASGIATTPNYPITSMNYGRLNTWTSDELAIANIKNALDNNKAVYLAFYWYPNTEQFQNFWRYDGQDDTFDPVAGVGSSGTLSGHGVTIIGYHDDGAGNGYWNVLNSWGTRSNRPMGTYYQDMYINYGAKVPGYNMYVTYYYTMDISFDPSALLQPSISGISPDHGWSGETTSFTISGDTFGTGADVRLTRTGVTPIVATGVSVPSEDTITGTFDLTGQEGGTWSVVVTNPNGLSATLTDGFVISSLNADFSYWPTTGVAPITIYFTDTSNGYPSPTTWNWDFTNDGVPDASGQTASWTFTAPGTHTVNLTVGNGIEAETVRTAIEYPVR